MSNSSEHPRHKSWRVGDVLIAAVIAIGAMLICVLVWGPELSHGRIGKSASAFAHEQYVRTQSKLVAGDSGVTSAVLTPKSQAGDPGWDALMKKVAALLKGEKPEACGMSDLDAALFFAEHESVDGLTMNHSNMGKDEANAALAAASSRLIRSDSSYEKTFGLYVQAQQAGMTATIAEPLVKLALDSRDPSIYALVTYACGSARIGACASISYADWAKIEPDNAAAWLKVADAAFQRKDSAARDEALRRAAAASRYDVRSPPWASLLDADAVKTQTPFVQGNVGILLVSMQGLSWGSLYGGVASYCIRGETTDPARIAVCDSLANKLLDDDINVLGPRIALKVGEKIGWDAARLQKIRDQSAVEYALAFDVETTGNVYTCENLAKGISWMKNSLSKGDRAFMRERVAKSGKTMTNFIDAYRKSNPSQFK